MRQHNHPAPTYLWLDRTIAHAAPYITLVRSEEAFLDAAAHCGIRNPDQCVHCADNLSVGGATTHTFEHDTDGICCVVAISVGPQTPIQIAALLVHEAVHIVEHYFEHICERHPASEQRAYAIQYISQTLMEEYLRQINQEYPE